ncbi:MAG: CcmD family protein [Dehalococcoidia bacterium]|nr:CcmD family protein [Dehalococcoidia bacterium]
MNNVRRLLAGAPLPLLGGAGLSVQPKGGPESNLPYLFTVFLVTWIAVFAYAVYMTRKQQALRRELDALRKLLEERDRTPTPPSSQQEPSGGRRS